MAITELIEKITFFCHMGPEIGKTKTPKEDSAIKAGVTTIAIEAPSAAPADTPINPGSASGFLNNPWSTAPDMPRLAPTRHDKSTRGSRISVITIR